MVILGLTLFAIAGAQTTNGSTGTTLRTVKPPAPPKAECAKGAICFSGTVSRESGFAWQISPELDFILKPGWTITVVPHLTTAGCTDDLSWPLTWPVQEHNGRYIDETYGWTAEQEVDTTPREFLFLTNCSDYKTAYDLYIKGDVGRLAALHHGSGRLWITNSKISHVHDTNDNKSGEIESMEFSVEILLPVAK
ncbi:MAG TPA: hypothetical protein VHC90_04500 [Bryobacteraceae bacterium]|nr:hypothetical protein [Bryobacteraceae bacterium]